MATVVIAPGTEREGDAFPAYRFLVEIEGITSDPARFQEVTGLGCQTEVVEFREGGGDQVLLLPGVTTCGPIVLTRGVTTNMELFEWYTHTMAGVVNRKTGSVVFLDRSGTEVLRFNFFEAWPAAYEIGKLGGLPGEAAIENLVIATEFIQLA